jgi:hypothetical protein
MLIRLDFHTSALPAAEIFLEYGVEAVWVEAVADPPKSIHANCNVIALDQGACSTRDIE